MVSKFEVIQYILFVDHDRNKYLEGFEQREVKMYRKFTVWKIKLLFIFLSLFFETLGSRDLQL